MSQTICQIINKSISEILAGKISTINTIQLEPKGYNQIEQVLEKNIFELSKIQTILSCHQDMLSALDKYVLENQIDVEKIGLENIIAKEESEITEETLIYKGNLDFNKYQLANLDKLNLPNNLKIIGGLTCRNADISNLNISCSQSYVDLTGCLNLSSVYIKVANSSFTMTNCPDLTNLVIGEVRNNFFLNSCPKLYISGIRSAFENKKIFVWRDIRLIATGLNGLSEADIRKKFDLLTDAKVIIIS